MNQHICCGSEAKCPGEAEESSSNMHHAWFPVTPFMSCRSDPSPRRAAGSDDSESWSRQSVCSLSPAFLARPAFTD